MSPVTDQLQVRNRQRIIHTSRRSAFKCSQYLRGWINFKSPLLRVTVKNTDSYDELTKGSDQYTEMPIYGDDKDDRHHWFTLRIIIDWSYRKIPKISSSMYKPLQIYAPQTGNAKNPPLSRPSKYKTPRGFYLENCPQIQRKTKKNW